MYLFLIVVVQSNNVCFVYSVTVVKQPSPSIFLLETSASTVHWTSPFSTCPQTHAPHVPRTNTGNRWRGRRVSLPLRDTIAIFQKERPASLTCSRPLMSNMTQLWTSHHHNTWGFHGSFKGLMVSHLFFHLSEVLQHVTQKCVWCISVSHGSYFGTSAHWDSKQKHAHREPQMRGGASVSVMMQWYTFQHVCVCVCVDHECQTSTRSCSLDQRATSDQTCSGRDKRAG